MASVLISGMTATTLGDAIRASIREAREREAQEARQAEPDMSTAEAQLARARERGLQIVTVVATGQRGWVVQELNYGCTLRIRLAGRRGEDAIARVPVSHVMYERR
ncbi:hypothetical protein ACFYMO_00900 [Streptomyces sp. NPDC007025]|uniref:hypothetical protein n=1 Tax=Streptomyces sp. NPDC007025 TaxID=3364771 RepID=UPI0036CD95EE